MPKSSSRACSPRGPGVSTTFSGLRSRWMMPLSWMAASPSASCIRTRAPALRCEGTAAQVLEERLPLRELHHQAGRVVGLTEVDDADHRRVLHAGEQPGLAPEALAHARLLAAPPGGAPSRPRAGPGSPARPGTPRPCRHPRGGPAHGSVPRGPVSSARARPIARYQPRGPGLTVVRVPTHRPMDRKRPLFGAPEGGWYRRRLHLSWLPRTRPEARFRPLQQGGLPGPSFDCWTGARSSVSPRSSCARASPSSTSRCRFPTSPSPSTSAAGSEVPAARSSTSASWRSRSTRS